MENSGMCGTVQSPGKQEQLQMKKYKASPPLISHLTLPPLRAVFQKDSISASLWHASEARGQTYFKVLQQAKLSYLQLHLLAFSTCKVIEGH